MDEPEAAKAVEQLAAELREAHETREDADRRIAGLRKLLEGYLELFPLLDELIDPADLVDEGDPFDSPRPRGMDAAFTVLKDNAGKWYTVATIVGMVDKRGWGPRSSSPRNAVRTALERLVEQGKIEKGKARDDGTVIYGIRSPGAPPVAAPKTGGYDDFGEEPF